MTTLILVLMVAVIVTGVLISAVAWRYANDARRRDVARAALLRHAATTDNWDDRLDHLEPRGHFESTPPVEPIGEITAIDTMFAAETRPPAAPKQSWIAVAAVCIVIALVAATVTARRS